MFFKLQNRVSYVKKRGCKIGVKLMEKKHQILDLLRLVAARVALIKKLVQAEVGGT